jgi:hypothetical protein
MRNGPCCESIERLCSNSVLLGFELLAYNLDSFFRALSRSNIGIIEIPGELNAIGNVCDSASNSLICFWIFPLENFRGGSGVRLRRLPRRSGLLGAEGMKPGFRLSAFLPSEIFTVDVFFELCFECLRFGHAA